MAPLKCLFINIANNIQQIFKLGRVQTGLVYQGNTNLGSTNYIRVQTNQINIFKRHKLFQSNI